MDNNSTESIRKELERLRSGYDELRREVDQLTAAESSSHDFSIPHKRGMLVSAGTIAESILKFIYRRERKDQGGKPCDSMTLDQLIPPLREQVPQHIEVPLRTVQAWRNFAGHDKGKRGDIRKVNGASFQAASNALSEVIIWFFDDYMGGEFANLAQRNGLEAAHNPRPEADLKHYLYVSRTKVEMLYAQIPSAHRRNLAVQLNIDLPLDQTAAPADGIADDVLLTKTKLVVQFLEEQGKVGTVDEPDAYFKGQLPLRWGPYDGSDLVYFGGATEETILGLGGSLKHVLGQLGGSYPSFSCPSYAAYIVRVLTDQLSLDADDGSSDYVAGGVFSANTEMNGPEENIEFVARKLVVEGRVLLGSPIYAALADT